MCTAVTLGDVVEHRDALRDANALAQSVHRRVAGASGLSARIDRLRRVHRARIVRSVVAGLALVAGTVLVTNVVAPADRYPDAAGIIGGFALMVALFVGTGYVVSVGAEIDDARNQLERIHDLTATLTDGEQVGLLDTICAEAADDPDRLEDLLSAAVDLLTGGPAAPASI